MARQCWRKRSLVGTREASVNPSFARHSPPACMLETGAPRPISTSFRTSSIPGFRASAGRNSGDVSFTGKTVSRPQAMIPVLLL